MSVLYDPRYQTWDSWASLMCEAYGSQQLAIPDGEENWKGWAAGLLAIDVFTNQGVPSPYIFDEWQDWASALINAMNGER